MPLILEILLIVDLFLWFLTLLPVPGSIAWASGWLSWIAAFILTVLIFTGGGHALSLR